MLYPFSRLLPPARSPASCGRARRRKTGFNLIESAIVLGVVGLVIGGIWIAASSVMENKRQADFLKNLLTVNSKIKSVFGSENVSPARRFQDIAGPTYLPKTTWPIIMPADMIGAGNLPITPWGTTIEIILSGMINTYRIYLPKSACISLGPQLTRLTVDIRSITTNVYTDSSFLPLSTTSEAVAACNTDDDGYGNVLVNVIVKRL